MSRQGFSGIAADAGLIARARGWLRGHVPSRERLEKQRWLRPIAHRVLHPALWRLTRRSVPRGVAIGFLTGILVPPAHFPASAALAFPFKANIPAAALTAIVVNPFTAPAYWLAAYKIGHWLLGPGVGMGGAMARPGWMHWLLAEVGPATALGLGTITIAAMAGGYGLSAIGWRLWIARKWRRRAHR